MATRMNTGGPSGLPLALISQAIPKLSRRDLVGLTERLIDRLDEIDGDPDIEEDDPAGQCDEDEINTLLHNRWATGAGCTISDPGEDCGDDEHRNYY